METLTGLAYRQVLDDNADAMITWLTGVAGKPRHLAEHMVTTAWERHVARLQADHPYEVTTREQAEAILSEALGFLQMLCRTGESYSPSALVDLGWHSLMLDSLVYFALCGVINGGKYIHHVPDTLPGEQFPALRSTVGAMAEYGPVNPALWPETAGCTGNCSSCGGGGRCRND